MALRDLGRRWEVTDNAFKPYTCGIVSHPVINSGIALRGAVGADEVATVTVRVNPVVLDVMAVADKQDGLGSKYGVYPAPSPSASCSAPPAHPVHDHGGPRSRGRRPDARVTADLDPAVARDEAFVTVTTTDGRTVEHHVEHATASAANPMTDELLRDKVRLVAAPVLGDDGVDRLVAAAFALDRAPDLEALTAAARPSA